MFSLKIEKLSSGAQPNDLMRHSCSAHFVSFTFVGRQLGHNSVCILGLKWENTFVHKSCKANINIGNWPGRAGLGWQAVAASAPQKSKPTISYWFSQFCFAPSLRVCVCLAWWCWSTTADCYSGLEEQACKESNTGLSSDTLFWNKTCTEIGNICQTMNLSAHNGTHCLNLTSSAAIPIRSVITRTLASEEYY